MNIYDQLKQLFKRMDDADKKIAEAVELPEVSGADNGNVLTVVSGAWAKAAIPSQLPAVTGADDGDVLTVVSGAWAKGSPSGGAVNYSTSEVDTGSKWIDGRSIYKKTFTGTLARGEYEYYYMQTLGSVDADVIVNCEKSLKDGSGNLLPVEGSLTSSASGYSDYSWPLRVVSGSLIAGFNQDTSAVGCTYYVTLYYVKAATETKVTKKKTTK